MRKIFLLLSAMAFAASISLAEEANTRESKAQNEEDISSIEIVGGELIIEESEEEFDDNLDDALEELEDAQNVYSK